MGESGGKAAACRRGRAAQAAPATDPLPGGAAPQPPGHPGQQLHSRGAGEFTLHVTGFTSIHADHQSGVHLYCIITPLHLIPVFNIFRVVDEMKL